MDEQDWLAENFEQHRPRLRAVSYRMLGSLSEADDAVQEAWLRLSGAETARIENLGAWLTTVVARICLNSLRSRAARREDPIDGYVPDPVVSSAADAVNPEDEALIADSVGLALLIVLDTLSPAERLAFVLHDVFDVPFDQIAPIIDRSEPATRQLASRARRRVRATPVPDARLAEQWELVDAFLAAARDGDFEGLLEVLDPDVVLRADSGAAEPVGVADPTRRSSRGVGCGHVQPAWARHSAGAGQRRPGNRHVLRRRPVAVLGFTVAHGRIVEMNILRDPARLRQLDLTVVAR